jgi:hypothetical protein
LVTNSLISRFFKYNAQQKSVTKLVTLFPSRAWLALPAFLLLAALAASAPLLPRISPHVLAEPADSAALPDDWPAGAVGDDWTPQALGERESRFARDFPGRIGVFSTPDGRTVVLRHVNRPTRKLHPAADCLRGLGYNVTPRPIFAQTDGVEWAEVAATRDNETLRARERILGADARAWTDLSAWYWSAALGRATGPWLAITELSPLPSSRRLAP